MPHSKPFVCGPGRESTAGPRQGRALWWPEMRSILLLLAVGGLVALILGAPFRSTPTVYRAGQIARQNVKAARDFTIPDPRATEEQRRRAAAHAPVVLDYDPSALDEALRQAQESLASLEVDAVGPEGPVVPDWAGLARKIEAQWGGAASPDEARVLASPEGRARFLETLRSLLAPVLRRGVVSRDAVRDGGRPVVVRDLRTRQETPLDDSSRFLRWDEARQALRGGGGAPPVEDLARRAAAHLVRPNVTLNSDETSARREAARQGVSPVLYLIRQGEMLVREGDRVSPEQALRLEAHARVAASAGASPARVGLFMLTLIAVSVVFGYGAANVKKFRCGPRDRVFLAALLVLLLGAERVGLWVLGTLGDAVGGVGGHEAIAYGLPLAAGALTVRAVLNSETALLFCLPAALLGSLLFSPSFPAFGVFLIGGLVGAHRAARACGRTDYLKAGLWTGLAQAAAIGCFGLLGAWPEGQAAWAAVWGLVGGVLAGGLSLLLVSLAESAFGYTSELRLAELGSLDHPLLRELMLRAPGTYHHSLVTGSLVKAAAQAIGARASLAAVAAYYHDIGKISKPAYFIENLPDRHNPHDRLTPRMSSLVLTSHVKEGVELARRHGLGRDITDIIQQHHGTGLIRYFHEKALQKARAGVEEVEESDYRYPGPPPQSREAALVLLADAVEAASRTLPDPKPARIQGMVQNIINRAFTDGQLDRCDLTLRDLHEIARSFARILSAIYHQRIDYPLAAHKEKRAHGDLDPKRPARGRSGRGDDPPQGEERLKRLGM